MRQIQGANDDVVTETITLEYEMLNEFRPIIILFKGSHTEISTHEESINAIPYLDEEPNQPFLEKEPNQPRT